MQFLRVSCLYSRDIIVSARDEGFVNQILSDIRTNEANRTIEFWQAGYVAYRHTRNARDAAIRAQEATVSALSITRGTGQARPLRQCPNKACGSTSHYTLARCPKSDHKVQCTACNRLGHTEAACFQTHPELCTPPGRRQRSISPSRNPAPLSPNAAARAAAAAAAKLASNNPNANSVTLQTPDIV